MALGNTHVANRLRSLRAPLAGPNGRVYATAIGSAQDDETALLVLAGKLRSPARADPGAVDDLAGSYALTRYPGDTDASLLAREEDPFGFHALGGTPQAIINAMQSLGIVDVWLLTEGHDGPIYEGSWYSRGRLILGPDFGTSGIGPSLLGTSTTLGSWILGADMTVAQRTTIKQLAWRWKDAYGVIPDVYLVFGAGSLLGVTGRLGIDFILGGYEQTSSLIIMDQFGSQTYLGSWVPGAVDLT